jgi:hypothetical protein
LDDDRHTSAPIPTKTPLVVVSPAKNAGGSSIATSERSACLPALVACRAQLAAA